MTGVNAATHVGKEAEKVRIFISYSHHKDDNDIQKDLMEFIRDEAERIGGEFWIDTMLQIGDEWNREIRKALAQADIAIVLVSQRYLNSRFVTEVEIKELIERRKRDGMVILPLILSACLWQQHDWLATTQFLPPSGQTIEEHYTDPGARKRLFTQFTKDLLKRIEEVKQKRKLDRVVNGSHVSDQLPPVHEEEGRIMPTAISPASMNTFQVISTSEIGRTALLNALDRQSVKFKSTMQEKVLSSHVFFVLEEGEQLEYPALHAYIKKGVRVFLIILVRERTISLHKMEEKAELLRAEVLARTKIQLEDIYVFNLAPGNQEIKGMSKLLQALKAAPSDESEVVNM